MYYLIYITINLKNCKFYIGRHKTKNLNDGYLGSGHKLKKVIKKFAKKNFYRLDLDFFNSEKQTIKREGELVNKEFLIKYKNHCYNISCGGPSGGDNISMHPDRNKIAEKQSINSKQRWADPEYHERVQKKRSKTMKTKEHRKLRSEIAKNLWKNDKYREKTIKGTKQGLNTKESKEKRSIIHKKLWENKKHRKKMIKILNTSDHKKKLSNSIKKLYKENPEIIKQQRKTQRKTLARPEIKEKMSKSAKKRWENNKARLSFSKTRRGNKNPSYSSKWMHNPKTKETSKIQKENIQKYSNNEWVFGRTYYKKPN